MIPDCSEAHRQLTAWRLITQEWNDRKSLEIDRNDIAPLETLLTYMSAKLAEINVFISGTEQKVEEIKEEYYG